ncbi:YtxH domain-containing protein [Nonomuraea sp. NPDC049152]|uniref:YtxH domain-containing protein n=1 Tax=Nonomuraea sp. NPDC049152 TaxID=3154350 RepID=UPI0033FEBE49
MTETDPGFSESHAGDVGARRATVGTPTDHESINVPPTRPGAAENAEAAEEARRPHEEFVPERPIPDEKAEAEAAARARHERDEQDTGTTGATRPENTDKPAGGVERDMSKDTKETRKDMGGTVEAMANKTGVKGRASEVAGVAKDKVTAVTDKVPDQVKDAADKVGAEVRRRPKLLLAAAGALAVLIARRMMQRGKK